MDSFDTESDHLILYPPQPVKFAPPDPGQTWGPFTHFLGELPTPRLKLLGPSTLGPLRAPVGPSGPLSPPRVELISRPGEAARPGDLGVPGAPRGLHAGSKRCSVSRADSTLRVCIMWVVRHGRYGRVGGWEVRLGIV